MTEGPHSTKLPQSRGKPDLINPAYLLSVILNVLLAPLVVLFVLLVLSGNVFDTRGKPSALRAETYA